MKRKTPLRPVIGVIGGIGSGKSLVAQMLQEMGCERIDADKVGHELLGRAEVVAGLKDRFGPGIVNAAGAVDRQELARLAFASEDSLAELNAVVHPRIREELARRVASFRAGPAPAAVLDAALLLETDWHELCDVLVFVDAPPEQRQARVKERGWSAEDLARREKFQKGLDKKRSVAEYVMENNSSVSYLHQQVRLLYQRLVSSSDRP